MMMMMTMQPIQLVICIGLLYGIGAGMLFGPTIHFMSEWFRARKSLAYGAMYVPSPPP